ncbi:UNVERIFIED_CONTAM: hypothetical protein Sradi_4390400 [Sesamum radiatum]|uniref:Uncharacterized protein n=1 Tax=Sesamum radiatum TaxID=300843 RepID=A0AAW2NSX0_SESRA
MVSIFNKQAWGFAKGFDQNCLDPSLDGNLEAFPDEDVPPPELDEFRALIKEVENLA